MRRQELAEAVWGVLAEIQACANRALPTLADDLCPMDDLEGFTSLNAVEAAAMLSAKLGFVVRSNVILAQYQGQAPTVGIIVDRLCPKDSEPDSLEGSAR